MFDFERMIRCTQKRYGFMAELRVTNKDVTPAPDLTSSGSSSGMAGLGRRGVEWWGDDAHHAIHTPGGYEWWRFESIDAAGNGVVIIFFEGLPFHPNYLSRLARWRRHNGRGNLFHNPPSDVLPAHYPALYIGVYQGGTRVAQALNMYPAGSFEGRSDLPEIRVGPNRLTPRSDGSFGLVVRAYPYDIHRGTPRRRSDLILSAALTFVPTFNGVQHIRSFRPPGVGGGIHQWIVAAPHGFLSGRVQMISPYRGGGGSGGGASVDTDSLVDLPIHALAMHDHNYGQAGLSEDTDKGHAVKRLALGYFLGENYTVAWQRTVVQGQNHSPTDAILLFEKDRPPVVIEEPLVETASMKTTRWLVNYPGQVRMNGSDAKGNSVELALNHSQLVERSPFHVRLLAEATLTIPGRQQYSGKGFTTVMQYQRLRWPLLSDMVLNSLQEIAEDDPLWRQ